MASLPPNNQATKSNPNNPTKPQFNEPIIESAKQILSIIISTPLVIIFSQKTNFMQKNKRGDFH